MEIFLSNTSNRLKNNNYENITLVLGNESCDLDSAACSIIYAMFLNWQYLQIQCKVCTRHPVEAKDNIFVPVLNVDREDYPLKTEVVFVLNKHGINESLLVFRDDHDLKLLVDKPNTKVVLVDHHVLAKNDKFLTKYVTEIIDHRPIDNTDWNYNKDTRCTIETVGSCCTLLAQRIKDLSALVAKDVDFFNAYLDCVDILYCTIILDTVNFSTEFNKGTPHDKDIMAFLESILKFEDPESEREKTLDSLMAAKANVNSLTAAQLLKKDLKVVDTAIIPSMPMTVKDYLSKPDVSQAVSTLLAQKQCNIAVILGMELKDGIKRDVAIYCEDHVKLGQLSKFLQEWMNPHLMLIPSKAIDDNSFVYFQQNNLSATRKQYLPAINAFLLVEP